MTLPEAILHLGISARADWIGNQIRGDWGKDEVRAWNVTLTYEDRTLAVPFYQGVGHTQAPTAADVLYCLAADAQSYANASGFEDWAGDLGYDPDSRKAEAIFRKCGEIEKDLRSFLADAYDLIIEASADY